jgi:hypothetical protein
VWGVTFFLSATLLGMALQAPTSPPTTQPLVITIGPNSPAHIPGSYTDPADLYGIVVGLIAIGVAILATRWLFGRGRRGSTPG